MKRKEATLEEWKLLYEIGIKIKELKPWEFLSDMDICSVEINNEASICSIMGAAGECFGIATYIGNNSIYNLGELIEKSEQMPPLQILRYQSSINCNFGNRDELTTKERDLIKDLGFKFRGKNNWIYFRTFNPKFDQFMPNKEEVLKLTEILKQLYESILIFKNGLKVDFKNHKTLMRSYDNNKKEWLSFEAEYVEVQFKNSILVLEDELLIKKLEKLPVYNSSFEIDIANLPTLYKEKEYVQPIRARMAILVDSELGMPVKQDIVNINNNDADYIFNIFINHMLEIGRKPKEIVVRDIYIGNIIMDLCKRIGVEIYQSPSLDIIDDFIEQFSMFGF